MILYNARIFDGKRYLDKTSIKIEDGKIAALGHESGDVDLGGRMVAPGLIDTHVHGYGGFDAMGGTHALRMLAQRLGKEGTTAFFPTAVTAAHGELYAFLQSVEQARGARGAKSCGAHLEGPYLNTTRRGAHDARLLRTPTVADYSEMTKDAGAVVKRITLAPELDEELRLTKSLVEKGVSVSAGHSQADGSQTRRAIDEGIRTCVHFFNGMDALHHRENNLVSTSLTDERMKIEFIPDLLHISEQCIKIVLRCKGDEGCYICTDALVCAGLDDGDYMLGTVAVSIRSGKIYTRDGGSLAGSSITLLEGVRRLVSIGIPAETALRLATANVAEAYRLHMGRIAQGYPADMIVLDDKLNLLETYIDGEPLMAAESMRLFS